MNNWGKEKMFVLYKGHGFETSYNMALNKAILGIAIYVFDKNKKRVVVATAS